MTRRSSAAKHQKGSSIRDVRTFHPLEGQQQHQPEEKNFNTKFKKTKQSNCRKYIKWWVSL
jgi:hypothetical protein